MRSLFASGILMLAVACSLSAVPPQREALAPGQGNGAVPAAGESRPPDQKTAAITEAKLNDAAAQPTPRTKSGHPDLTGYWGPVIEMFGFDGKKFISEAGSSRPLFGEATEAGNAKGYYDGKANYDKNADSRPVYKPEFRDKQRDNFMRSEVLDPSYKCLPEGVPRLGAPNEVFQSDEAVVLLYENPFDRPNHFTYRVIPTDGRRHDPDADPMPLGDSVGHWEGDTLIIDVIKLSLNTWFDARGSFHDETAHVIERLTRKGNTLVYSSTWEDPTLLEQPYSTKPVTLILKPGEHSHEDYPCVERDQEHVTYEQTTK